MVSVSDYAACSKRSTLADQALSLPGAMERMLLVWPCTGSCTRVSNCAACSSAGSDVLPEYQCNAIFFQKPKTSRPATHRQHHEALSGGQVPQARCVVVATCRNLAPIGRVCHRSDGAGVTLNCAGCRDAARWGQ